MDGKRTLTNEEIDTMLDALTEKNVELFPMTREEIEEHAWTDEDGDPMPVGFYAWICSPGCLPDTEPLYLGKLREPAIQEAWDFYVGDTV